MSLKNIVCIDGLEVYIFVFLFFLICINLLRRNKQFNKLISEKDSIKSKDNFNPKGIIAPRNVNCEKHRAKHIYYTLELWFYVFTTVFILMMLREISDKFGCFL